MPRNRYSLLMKSLGLPDFSTIDELSELTGLSTRIIYCLSKLTERYYKVKLIKKRNGGTREISIPSFTLHIVQRWVLVNILNKLVPSEQSMAFRKGRAYGNKQNAICHAHTLYGLSIDLKDFFPSISSDKVYTVFSSLGYNEFAASILTNLCTLKGRLPQGSPCSPAISNLICITLDKRLAGLCEKRGIIYTRYADDMYFSCDDKVLLLRYFPVFVRIIEDEGFTVNNSKVHFYTPSNRKRITGITVVQDSVGETSELKAPKEMKRKIRAEIFKCIVSGNYENRAHILGEIAYVSFVEKNNAHSYMDAVKKYIGSTARKIVYYPELVERYNQNLFFDDMTAIEPVCVNQGDGADLHNLCRMLSERRVFLRKNQLEDICTYENWNRLVVLTVGLN